MRVAVTGGTGLVESHTVAALCAEGHDVYRTHDPHDAWVALDIFYGWAADSGIPACERLARARGRAPRSVAKSP